MYPGGQLAGFFFDHGAGFTAQVFWRHDRSLTRDDAASVTSTIAFPARLLTAQGKVQTAACASVNIDMSIEGFMADPEQSVGLDIAGGLFRALQAASLALAKAQVPAVMRRPFSRTFVRVRESSCGCLGR